MNRGWSSRRSKPRQMIHALKSWLTRHLHKSPRAMTSALSDDGFQRSRAPRALSTPSIHGIPKLGATLGSSGAARNSIPPVPERKLVHEAVIPVVFQIFCSSSNRRRNGLTTGVPFRMNSRFMLQYIRDGLSFANILTSYFNHTYSFPSRTSYSPLSHEFSPFAPSSSQRPICHRSLEESSNIFESAYQKLFPLVF
jgi:hypothetical protein